MANTTTVVQAWDRSPIEELTLNEWPEIDSWLANAEKLCLQKASKPRHERAAILNRIAAALEARVEEFAILIAREGGKPYPDAKVEAQRAVAGVRVAITEMEKLNGEEIAMDLTAAGAGHRGFTFRQPRGPVVAISAFNHPLNLIVHQVVPAIAVGAPVIVKPADATPLNCLRFVDIVHEAGLDEAWCKAVITDIPTAERLATDPRVGFFTFIGSAKVGWSLRSKLAPGTRCALEHGGAAPVIVGPDADLEATVPSLVKGGYYHAGQVCVSVQRIFVHKSRHGEMTERLKAAVDQLKTADPTLPDTEVGPLIRPGEVTRVGEWVDEAVAGGAKLVTGGKALSETAFQPTILDAPATDAKVSTLEIFGPVTCVYPFDALDDAMAQANALPYAFQSAVFDKNIDFCLTCAEKYDAATVMINDHTAFRVDWMPFAGLKYSGYGVGGIGYTMRDMTHEKLVVIKSSAF